MTVSHKLFADFNFEAVTNDKFVFNDVKGMFAKNKSDLRL